MTRQWKCRECGWVHNNTTRNPLKCGKCGRLSEGHQV